MEYMKIGHSGIEASVMTLGAMPLGGGTWWRNSEDEASIRTIHQARELGITTIDTAPIYGLGHSEEVVGRAIAGARDQYVLSTKATFDWDTGKGRFWNDVDGHKVYVDHSYEGIKRTVRTASGGWVRTISTSITPTIPPRSLRSTLWRRPCGP